MSSRSTIKVYKAYVYHRKVVFFALILGLGTMFLVSLSVGSSQVSLRDAAVALLGHADGVTSTILWHIRLPRILGAVFAGWGLAMGGVVMQCILHNPLASPYTLGVSQGAAFGAAFALVILGFGPSGKSEEFLAGPLWSVSTFAFLGALASTWLILFLSQRRRLAPEAIVLSGVALSALATSGTMIIQYFANDIEVASIVFWTFGDVGRASWNELLLMVFFLVPASLFFLINRWNMNALAAGDDVAKSLGVNAEHLRKTSLTMAALVAAVAVATFGVIGFIGLAAPHITRRLVGGDHRHLVPQSCVMGALILLCSDTVARSVMAPIVLPVGIVTSFMGAPLFLYLLAKGGYGKS
jgi:iron complex transport system permease protein